MRGSRPTSIATRSASTWSPTPGSRPACKHEAGYVLRQGEITFVLASPLRPDHPDARRLIEHGDGVQTIALEVDDVAAAFEAAVARGARPATPPRTIAGRVRRLRVRRDPRLRRHDAHVRQPLAVSRRLRAGLQAARPGPLQPAHVPSRRPEGDRPHRRQRRGRQDGRLGRLLQQGPGLLAPGQLRRQGHQHRVLGARCPRSSPTAAAGSSSRSTSRPRAGGGRRSTSTWSSTAGRACSTSRMATGRHRRQRSGHGRQRRLVPEGAAGLL